MPNPINMPDNIYPLKPKKTQQNTVDPQKQFTTPNYYATPLKNETPTPKAASVQSRGYQKPYVYGEDPTKNQLKSNATHTPYYNLGTPNQTTNYDRTPISVPFKRRQRIPSPINYSQIAAPYNNTTFDEFYDSYFPPFHHNEQKYMPNSNARMMPLYGYDNSADIEKDLNYLKQLYPKSVLSIQVKVMSECDKLEYDGSFMFDEYPDKLSIEKIIDRIFDQIKDMETNTTVKANGYGYHPRPCNPCIRDIVAVLLLNEFCNRRRRYRCRRRCY